MNHKEIYELALAAVIAPDDAAYYRKLCRQYSTLFHTPLPEVYALNPDEVLRDVYEHNLAQMEDEEIDVIADRIVSPEDYQEDEVDQYVKDLEAREKAKKTKTKTVTRNYDK
jgi:F420-0:gamma-glutamyl ligase